MKTLALRTTLFVLTVGLVVGSLLSMASLQGGSAARAAGVLPPIVFVARSQLATKDTIFQNDVGPAGIGAGLASHPSMGIIMWNPIRWSFSWTELRWIHPFWLVGSSRWRSAAPWLC